MSIRRAVELNFQSRIGREMQGSRYKVVGGISEEERPSPCVIVIGGEFDPAFPELNDSQGNYMCNLTVLILSSIDVDGVNQHNDACGIVNSVFNLKETRKQSLVEKLYLYDVVKTGVSEENDIENRKIGTAFNFKVVLHYEE